LDAKCAKKGISEKKPVIKLRRVKALGDAAKGQIYS
jgi:hypothetical protein